MEALAAAYGEFGMVLQAAEYFDAAEPPYLNAQKLSPDDARWPYYLATSLQEEATYALAVHDTAGAERAVTQLLALRDAPEPAAAATTDSLRRWLRARRR